MCHRVLDPNHRRLTYSKLNENRQKIPRQDIIAKFWPHIIEEEKMEAALVERLTAALEALATTSRPVESRAVALLKEINHIKEYDGSRNGLTQFINVVSNQLDVVDDQRKKDLWQLIYNTKIVGRAKELLLHNRPETWEQARDLLKQHFRPIINHKDVTRKIVSLRVSSIFDLNCKVESLIQEINSFATYENNVNQTRESLYSLLITQIKQIVSGNLSREIKDEFNLHKIKEILYTYVGYDHPNLDKSYLTMDRRQVQNNRPRNNHDPNNHHQKSNHNHFNHRPNSDQFRRDRYAQQNNRPRSDQIRQPVFNPSGQIRNARQHPEPMDVGQVVHQNHLEEIRDEEVHNIDPEFFLN